MAIRPADIRRKEFKGGFRGYDANQVDDFLDSVADEFERLFSENRRLTEEVVSLRERLGQFEELEDSIRTALVHAEQVSRDLRQNATKEAELIVREAKERAHRILADSSGRVERVQDSYEVLRKAKQDFANDFRRLLKGYLEVMDNVDVASAKEIEASLRERLDLESVATARQAAENRGRTDDDTLTGTEAGDSETTRHIQTVVTPAGDTTSGLGLEPEVQEPEVEPSSAQNSRGQERAAREAAAAPGPADAAEEVNREEPMPTRESRVADQFFGQGESRAEDAEEERKLFRASRFLRRRDD
ncbi:MAG: DivIVA domain-containing protein [Rubrobacter sp.]|nr:DivIVA domain-containing protein [Rubrobacter sp.]